MVIPARRKARSMVCIRSRWEMYLALPSLTERMRWSSRGSDMADPSFTQAVGPAAGTFLPAVGGGGAGVGPLPLPPEVALLHPVGDGGPGKDLVLLPDPVDVEGGVQAVGGQGVQPGVQGEEL